MPVFPNLQALKGMGGLNGLRKVLLERLDQIALSLQDTKKACALLGFGSVGTETDRMDEYSDLDFLVVAKNRNQL